MVLFLADENFDQAIIDAVRRNVPAFSVLLAEDVGLRETPVEVVLGWAAARGMVVLTHDGRTMIQRRTSE